MPGLGEFNKNLELCRALSLWGSRRGACPSFHAALYQLFRIWSTKKKNFFYRELFTFLDLFSLSSKCLRNKIAWIVSIYRLHHLRHRLAMSWQCPSQAATFTTDAARRRDSPYWESRELSPGKTELRPPLVNCLSRFVLWRFWLWWAWLSTWKVTFLSSIGTFEI